MKEFTVCGYALFAPEERSKISPTLNWPRVFYQYGIRSFMRYVLAEDAQEAATKAGDDMRREVFRFQGVQEETMIISAVFAGILDNIK